MSDITIADRFFVGAFILAILMIIFVFISVFLHSIGVFISFISIIIAVSVVPIVVGDICIRLIDRFA